MKGKTMTMEKTTLEVCRVVGFGERDETLRFSSQDWNHIPMFESIDVRKPSRTRLRLTEWFEGAPFFPAIRQRSEPE
jgi:hypothetical protein